MDILNKIFFSRFDLFLVVWMIVVACLFFWYRVKYVDMSEWYDWHNVRRWIIAVVLILASLGLLEYIGFNLHVDHVYVRVQTILIFVTLSASIKLYGMYGGAGIADLYEIGKLLVRFRVGDYEDVKLFSLNRLIDYAMVNKNNNTERDKLDSIGRVINHVTSQACGFVSKKNIINQMTLDQAKEFTAKIGEITRRHYRLLQTIKMDEGLLETIQYSLASMTKSYDNKLIAILMSDDVDDSERKDKIIDTLDKFGEEIDKEIVSLVRLNK